MTDSINWCDLKKNAKHIGEVSTSRIDGSPTGAEILTSTNEVTGQERDTLAGKFKKIDDAFSSITSSQFIVTNFGNWSTVAGQQIVAGDELKGYEYPDDSGDVYAVKGSVTLPITRPASPIGDDRFYLASAVNVEKMRSEIFSAAGYSYQGEWVSGMSIPALPDRVNGYALWEPTIGKIALPIKDEAFTTGVTFQDDLNDGKFLELSILDNYSDISQTHPSFSFSSITRNMREILSDSINIKTHGGAIGNGIYSDAPTDTQALINCLNIIKTLHHRGTGAIWFPDGRYWINQNMPLDFDGIRLLGDDAWGSQISFTDDVTTAGFTVLASSVEISNIYITSNNDCVGLHLKDGNNFRSENLTIKLSRIGLWHEKNNSAWIRNLVCESCITGYLMRPSLVSDCNGSYIHGRSYNCEIGFDLQRDPSDPTKQPGMNEIHYSCEGNTIGFRQNGGRYNELHIYSESNTRTSTATPANVNANFVTDGSPNYWAARNPDNDTDIIKGTAIGWFTRGGSIIEKKAQYEGNVSIVNGSGTFSLNGAENSIFYVTNTDASTAQLQLNFLPYMRQGQCITLISTDGENGMILRQQGGVNLIGDKRDGDLWGAFVTPQDVDILRITKLNDTTAFTELGGFRDSKAQV